MDIPLKGGHPVNDDEDPVKDMAEYWAARCVMRYLLGYPAGSITIDEDGESYFDDPVHVEVEIEAPHDILISLAGLVGTGGWLLKEPPLTHPGRDLQEVRETLTVEYRQHFFPLDNGVISQDDAIQVYWGQAVERLLDPFAAWALECLSKELWRGKGMAAHDIQHLLEDLDARSREPAPPPI